MPTRLENLIHYIISVTPPENLGATKLAKIVWFADIEFYRLHGSTVTRADDYQRRDQGPLHADFNRSLAALKREAKISERAVQTPAGARREFVWLTPPAMDDFSGPEIAIVHNVINTIVPMSAKEASNLSHVEPWLSGYSGERLPVPAAAVIWGEVTDEDMAWADQIAHEHRSAV